MRWNITGYIIGSDDLIELSWDSNNIGEDYEVYLYSGENSYNMKNQLSVLIPSSSLSPSYINGNFIANTYILVGGCASTGLTNFYIDNDGDGLGSTFEGEYCDGFEPEGLTANNLDINDQIFCESNDIDSCDICDGLNQDEDCNGDCFGTAALDDCGICSEGNTSHESNSDKDCNGDCFGTAALDDCGICNDSNQSCLDSIFGAGPSKFYAHIQEDAINLSWEYDEIESLPFILGFNLYHIDGGWIGQTETLQYTVSNYQEGNFCITAYDRFNNETEYLCAEASNQQQYCWGLSDGPNLISYPGLPDDNSIDFLISPIYDKVEGVIAQGKSALKHNGSWIGSLTHMEETRGYWVIIDIEDPFGVVDYCIAGYPINQNTVYNLIEGNNLVSFLGPDGSSINEAIPNGLIEYVTSIISQSEATTYYNENFGWVGSLDEFNLQLGYWIHVTHDIEFHWNVENQSFLINKVNKPKNPLDPKVQAQ